MIGGYWWVVGTGVVRISAALMPGRSLYRAVVWIPRVRSSEHTAFDSRRKSHFEWTNQLHTKNLSAETHRDAGQLIFQGVTTHFRLAACLGDAHATSSRIMATYFSKVRLGLQQAIVPIQGRSSRATWRSLSLLRQIADAELRSA